MRWREGEVEGRGGGGEVRWRGGEMEGYWRAFFNEVHI